MFKVCAPFLAFPREWIFQLSLSRVKIGVQACLAQLLINHRDFHISIIPGSIYLCILLVLFFPAKTLYWTSRKFIIRRLARTLTFGFLPVIFTDFWIADQFNSLNGAFQQFSQVSCALFNSGNRNGSCRFPAIYIAFAVGMIPPLIRFGQCIRRYVDTWDVFPHLYNSGKYLCGCFVIISSLFTHLYPNATWTLVFDITTHIINSYSTIWWDLNMDFGFFENGFKKRKNTPRFLRERMVLNESFHWLYYFAIVEDVVLRLVWIIKILVFRLLKVRGKVYSEGVVAVFNVLEIFRRAVWNFLRLENEHLNNVGQFRVMRNISLNDKSVVDTVDDLESMMDASTHNAREIFTRKAYDEKWLQESNKDTRKGR